MPPGRGLWAVPGGFIEQRESAYQSAVRELAEETHLHLLDDTLRLKAEPRIRFAGQITGCEGYVESAAVGLFAGRAAAAEVAGRTLTPPPPTTALGALLTHITGGARADSFQPMNVNFGLFPPIDGVGTGRKAKGDRKAGLAARAVADMGDWLGA